jgi:arylsulfatase A-like enzyme
MSQPNILLFITDGMQGRTVMPGHDCQTPTMDALAARGVRIGRAYTTLPTCSPARASMMTGLLPHNHGVLQVEHTVDDDQCELRDVPHFAQRLQTAGYQTAYFGKWHIERSLEASDFGWQINELMGKEGHRRQSEQGIRAEETLDPALSRWHTGPAGYNDTLHYGVTDTPVEDRVAVSGPADAACEFLADAPSDQPWCCCVSYYGPNEAMIVGRDAYNRYDPAQLTLPENRRDDLAGRPNIYRRTSQIFADVSDAEWQQAHACYYGRISELDDQLARVVAALEANGQLANTVIIVTADHGKYVGAHGFEAHNFGAFEEIYHIPMIVAGPGVAEGVDSKARVGLHDLCPTILELADAPAIDVPDSQSFAPVLADPAAADSAFSEGYAEYHGTRFTLTQRICWDGDWKFVFNGFDFDELYNLAEDPWEMTNRIDDPAEQERVQAMMRAVWRRIRETDDRPLLNTHYYSMRFAAIGPAEQ